MPELVQIDRKSERLAGPLDNTAIDLPTVHWTSLFRSPQTVMLGGTGDRISEFGQVAVDAR